MKRKIGSTYFNDELVYDGNDLGAVYTKEKTTFRIWTPAAGKVSLNLYEQGDDDNLIETIPMTADVKGTPNAAFKAIDPVGITSTSCTL